MLSAPPSWKPGSSPAGGAVSFESLYEQHAGQVFVWALRYARGRQAWAEDVVHDVFVKVWQHRAWLREEDVRGWLFRVTQNVAFSLLRREATLAGRIHSAVEAMFGGDAPTPEESLERRRALDTATGALNRLPGQERVVTALKLLDGLSQREIAQLLSLSEGYVSKLIRRARSRLESWGWRLDDDSP
jgi:RNA polymerase sigma factor (sigma-70 family)